MSFIDRVYTACFSWFQCQFCMECFSTWELHLYQAFRSGYTYDDFVVGDSYIIVSSTVCCGL